MIYNLFNNLEALTFFDGGNQAFVDRFYQTYREWTVSSKFVGVTEELGAKRCKSDAMSIADPGNNYALPIKPASFQALESALDTTDKFQNTLYKNLIKEPFIHNVISGNFVQARAAL